MKVMATRTPASAGVFLNSDDPAFVAIVKLAPFEVTAHWKLPANIWFGFSN